MNNKFLRTILSIEISFIFRFLEKRQEVAAVFFDFVVANNKNYLFMGCLIWDLKREKYTHWKYSIYIKNISFINQRTFNYLAIAVNRNVEKIVFDSWKKVNQYLIHYGENEMETSNLFGFIKKEHYDPNTQV